jgi:hypothetical protein
MGIELRNIKRNKRVVGFVVYGFEPIDHRLRISPLVNTGSFSDLIADVIDITLLTFNSEFAFCRTH